MLNLRTMQSHQIGYILICDARECACATVNNARVNQQTPAPPASICLPPSFYAIELYGEASGALGGHCQFR